MNCIKLFRVRFRHCRKTGNQIGIFRLIVSFTRPSEEKMSSHIHRRVRLFHFVTSRFPRNPLNEYLNVSFKRPAIESLM